LNALDKTYGGFFTYVNLDGSIDTSKTYKISFVQSRNAYAMAKAYQLTGENQYLEAARSALDFVYEYAWDKENGGWIQEMDQQGTAVNNGLEGMDWNSIKWSYNQLSMLEGISAMVEVTQSKTDLEWLEKSYSMYTDNMWDSREGYEGYYDMMGVNWSNPQGKNIGSVNSIINTHQMTLTLLNQNNEYKERLLSTADRMALIAQSIENRTFGVEEYYDLDWKAITGPKTTYSGNLIELASSLAMAYTIDPKPIYQLTSERIIKELLSSNAYDHQNGGFFSTIDLETGFPTDSSKSWWILGSTVKTGLLQYYLFGNGNYLKMADESMNFFMDYMYDRTYGDCYGSAKANGIVKNDIQKGDYWKDASDIMKLFYYTYCYGNLILQDQPISLYYQLDPTNQDRHLTLQPISLGKDKLMITGVTLNGEEYREFGVLSCSLDIPANMGGEFKVTFEPIN
jgi:mannobiose 2-epimerase